MPEPGGERQEYERRAGLEHPLEKPERVRCPECGIEPPYHVGDCSLRRSDAASSVPVGGAPRDDVVEMPTRQEADFLLEALQGSLAAPLEAKLRVWAGQERRDGA